MTPVVPSLSHASDSLVQSSATTARLTVVTGGKAAARASDAAPALNSEPAPASKKELLERPGDQTDALVERAKQGDRTAFRLLVERHQRRAFAIAITLVRDEEDAREIVQEAFLRVHRGLNGFTGNSSFFTWLYRIVTNLSIDFMRKPGRRDADSRELRVLRDENYIPFLSRFPDAVPFDAVRRREVAQQIQTALDALPPYHRGVIVMREVEGMSYDEMAQAMNVSKGTIMSRLFHARQKLQHALASFYAAELDRPLTASNKP